MLVLAAPAASGYVVSFPCQLGANPHPREPSSPSHAHSWFSLEAPTLLPGSTLLPNPTLHEEGRADCPLEARGGLGTSPCSALQSLGCLLSQPHPEQRETATEFARAFL